MVTVLSALLLLMVQVEEETVVRRRSSREMKNKSAAKSPDVETLPSRDNSAMVIVVSASRRPCCRLCFCQSWVDLYEMWGLGRLWIEKS